MIKAIDYFKLMFSNQKMACDYGLLNSIDLNYKFWFIFTIAIFFSFIKLFNFSTKLENFVYKNQKIKILQILQFLIFLFLLILSIGEFASADFKPFIYSQF